MIMIYPSEITKKWPHRPLSEVVDFLDSKRKPITQKERVPGPYPYYGANGQQDSVADYIFDEPLVLLAEDGGHFGDADKTIAYQVEGKCWVNNHAHVLRPKKDVDIRYICRHLERYDVTPFITGSTRGKLTKTAANNIPIALPPLEEQRRIAAILDKADGVRRKRKEAIRLTEELLKSTFLEMFGDPVTNPKGWEVKTIEDITVNQKGAIKRGPFGGALKKDIFIQAGFLVYEQYHALNNDFSFERYYISEDKFEEMKGFEVKPGDIIISCSGVYLGKLAIVPENAKPGIINQALLRITLNQRKMNNYFFLYHFSHESFRDKFFAANRGSGVPNFPPISEFKTFPFIVPPIEDQNKFSARLQQIQGFQSKAYESIKESENLFNSLLQRAFRGEL
jgi:type I restriction enzyme S subunit